MERNKPESFNEVQDHEMVHVESLSCEKNVRWSKDNRFRVNRYTFSITVRGSEFRRVINMEPDTVLPDINYTVTKAEWNDFELAFDKKQQAKV